MSHHAKEDMSDGKAKETAYLFSRKPRQKQIWSFIIKNNF